ncbi:hypothetical protein BC826DRAFT_1056757 [Russula brevipes]|nr:hypothetical protein BC826DRAFT_1056757 [Russula brevipes]
MAVVNSARHCPICLEKFHDPVVTPCGHVGCGACMRTHARGSNNSYEATCPTCSALFSIVTPDMSIIPQQYHVFISPPLRRVSLGDSSVDASTAIEEGLRAKIAALNTRVAELSDERAARLAQDSEREEEHLPNMIKGGVVILSLFLSFLFFFGSLLGCVYFSIYFSILFVIL